MHLRRGSVNAALAVAALATASAHANFGIGTSAARAGVDVAGVGTSSALLVPRDTSANRPSPGVNGMVRYNTGAAAFEGFLNGGWRFFVPQAPGSTSGQTAVGPPVNANVYTPTSASCNFTPGYGTCAGVTNGTWPANGSGNAGCTNFPIGTNTIVLDLGATKAIRNFYVSMYADGGYMLLGISFSNDNALYSTSIGFATSGSATQYGAGAVTPSQTARYVRLVNGAPNAYSNNNYICQFAVGP